MARRWSGHSWLAHSAEWQPRLGVYSSTVSRLVNTAFRLVLAIWVLGYIVFACGPLVTGDASAGGLGLILGSVLLVPWLIGVLVLGVFVWLTNPRR